MGAQKRFCELGSHEGDVLVALHFLCVSCSPVAVVGLGAGCEPADAVDEPGGAPAAAGVCCASD